MFLYLLSICFSFIFLSQSVDAALPAAITLQAQVDVKENDDKKNVPLITQALMQPLSQEDKNIINLLEQAAGNDQKQIKNILNLLLLHYQSIEVYLAEKVAAQQGLDDAPFDKTLASLLEAEANVYSQLTPTLKDLWKNFQKHLAANDSQFNFESFITLSCARKEFCCHAKFFFTHFLEIEKTFEGILANLEKIQLEEASKKNFLPKIQKLKRATA